MSIRPGRRNERFQLPSAGKIVVLTAALDRRHVYRYNLFYQHCGFSLPLTAFTSCKSRVVHDLSLATIAENARNNGTRYFTHLRSLTLPGKIWMIRPLYLR
jgi:hypothetical protein